MSTFLCSMSMAAQSKKLSTKVYFRFSAFIPSLHPGLPDYVKKIDAKSFVIRAPDIFPSPYVGTCYLTDNRWFNGDLSAFSSTRISIIFFVEIKGKEVSVYPMDGIPQKYVGESRNVDCETGKDLHTPRRAKLDGIFVGEVKKRNFSRSLYVSAAVSNPFYPTFLIPGTSTSFGLSPDIDMRFSILYDLIHRKFEINGTVGYFPSFEAYYKVGDGEWISMFQLSPYLDSTVLSLADFNFGINTRNINSEIKLPN
jgi:hypothetical protein